MAAKPRLPRVYLLRHGATAWTVTGQHTGRTDVPLNDQGERQARAIAPRLAALPIDHVMASPLQRARRTAELAMPEARIELDDDLMEWDYGAYDGRTTADIRAERPDWGLFRDGCPGGETIDAVGARADRVIGRVRGRVGHVLLVGHREILRILAARWIGLAPAAGGGLMLDTATLSVLGYDHDLNEPAIHVWNDQGAAAAGAH